MGSATAPAHRAVSTPAYVCDCCGRTVDYVRGSMWHGNARICRGCFYLWYETAECDPGALKAEVLRCEAAGEWPFDGSVLL